MREEEGEVSHRSQTNSLCLEVGRALTDAKVRGALLAGGVESGKDALLARGLLDCLDDILVLVVEALRSSERDETGVVGRRSSGEDTVAGEGSELDGMVANGGGA